MQTRKHTIDPEKWVDEYGDYLYKYAMMRLGDPVTASDVVQETFLAGIKGLDRYDGRVDAKYWLRGILRNKVVDHIRKSSREAPLKQDEGGEELMDSLMFKITGVPGTNPDPWAFNPYKAFENSEFWEVLEGCLAKLGGTMRRAFSLKMLEDMPTEEICETLNLTRNSFWVTMHRARQQLKSCLERNWIRGQE